MSNPFEPPTGPPPSSSKGGSAAATATNPFEPPSSSSTANQAGASASAGMSSNLNQNPGSSTLAPAIPEVHDTDIHDEPPPAYTSVASAAQGHSTVVAGPSRMDFSGPPPIPDRMQQQQQSQSYLQQNYTGGSGSGFGHGPGPGPGYGSNQGNSYGNGSWNGSQQGEMEAQITGVGFGHGPRRHAGDVGTGSGPPSMPPRHPSNLKPPPPPPQQSNSYHSSSAAGPSAPRDTTPTEVPTPGRPLLRNGQLLVYPKNHFCSKCNNTGYKNNDPGHPCSKDWSKYGKPYTGALASSFTTVTGPNTNPSTQAATNFQRPLPDLRPPTNTGSGPGPGPGQGMNGGGWKQHPGNHLPPPMQSPYRPPGQFGGPPPPPPHGFGFGGGGGMAPQINVQHNYGGYVPPGAIRVGPGDPRIGGVICWRCGGYGRELSFFGFDDGKCKECRGLGRVFQ